MLNIKKMLVVIISVMIFVAAFSNMCVYADDTNLGRTPEGVFPINEKDIVLESENITVDLEKGDVECIFIFNNTGEAKNVLMGFPGKIQNNAVNRLTDDVDLEIRDFKAYLNGKKLPIKHENAIEQSQISTSQAITNELKYSEYFTFSVPFKAKQKITVKNTYKFNSTFDSVGNVFSGYVLKTGAMWKGSIGYAKITFKLGNIQPYQLEELKPGGFKFAGKNLVWERKNFEPYYDLSLRYNTWHYKPEYMENEYTTPEEIKKIKLKINKYNEAKKLADKGKIGELLNLYKKAVSELDPIFANYIAGFIPPGRIPYNNPSFGDIIIEKRNNDYYVFCEVLGTEDPFVQLTISHYDDGTEIIDTQIDNTATFIKFLPDIEYNITYTLRDWKDRVLEKTISYKVPEMVSSENATGLSGEANKDGEIFAYASKPSTRKNNVLTSEIDNSKNNISTITFVIIGIILVVILALAVFIWNNTHRRKVK